MWSLWHSAYLLDVLPDVLPDVLLDDLPDALLDDLLGVLLDGVVLQVSWRRIEFLLDGSNEPYGRSHPCQCQC